MMRLKIERKMRPQVKSGALNTAVPIGNGIWDCAGYWRVAHFSGARQRSCPAGLHRGRHDQSIQRLPIRDELYQRPLAGAEIGAPRCNPLGAKNRRILNAAIINCSSSPVAVTRNARDVPVAGFGKFFLTLPAAADAGPYAEFLKSPSSRPTRSITTWFNCFGDLAHLDEPRCLYEGSDRCRATIEGSALVEAAILVPVLLITRARRVRIFLVDLPAALDLNRHPRRRALYCAIRQPPRCNVQGDAKNLATTGAIDGNSAHQSRAGRRATCLLVTPLFIIRW